MGTKRNEGPEGLAIAVASGKGGTGKTLVATNLASWLRKAGRHVVLADCDVEAPNDHLFLAADVLERLVVSVTIPSVDATECSVCGRCRDFCRYGALRILGGRVHVFPELCHSCGGCLDVCPTGALVEEARRVGEVCLSAGDNVPTLITGRLDVGEVKTPDVIRRVRNWAASLRPEIVVIDAPPGVGCAAVASTRDVNLLLLVTEPTPFGLHDLDLSVALGRRLQLPMGVVLNRVGIGSEDVEAYCRRQSLPLLARIPFDRSIAEAYADGHLILDSHPEVHKWCSDIQSSIGALGKPFTLEMTSQ